MIMELPKDAKNDDESENLFKPTKELESIEDINAVSEWFKQEVGEYVDEHNDFMMGYHYDDLIKNILEYLSSKFEVKIGDNIKINHEEVLGEDTEGTTGKFYILGKGILMYSYGEDGMGMNISGWSDENLKQVFGEILKKQ